MFNAQATRTEESRTTSILRAAPLALLILALGSVAVAHEAGMGDGAQREAVAMQTAQGDRAPATQQPADEQRKDSEDRPTI